MKQTILTIALALMAVFCANAQTDSLLYHFDFLTTADDSGVYTGKLCQGATLHDYNDQHVLDLGSDNGYFDFGEEFGKVIGSLSGNYTIAVNVFVPEDADISHNGNFIWCFARSSSEGYLFLNAKDSRFAITLTDYEGEVGVTARNPLKQGQWNSFVLVHSGNTVRLYVNGVSASKSVRIHPADIGSTTQNYIGRSCYEGDAYLRDVLVHDFLHLLYYLVCELGVRRERDVLFLHGRVKKYSAASCRSLLVMVVVYTDAFLEDQVHAGFADQVPEVDKFTRIAWPLRREKLFATKILVIGVFLKLLHDGFVRNIADVLQDDESRHEAYRLVWRPIFLLNSFENSVSKTFQLILFASM